MMPASVLLRYGICICISKYLKLDNMPNKICTCILFTCATSGEGPVYACSAPELAPDFCGVPVAPSLVFCVVFDLSLFDHCNVSPLIC